VPSRADVALLYRRAGFGLPLDQVDALVDTPWETLVENLLTVDTSPIARPSFMDDSEVADWEREFMLRNWWMDRMMHPTHPLQERMTYIWHGHFCSANSKVADMNRMYEQQALFREHGMGNFRDLVHAMSLQPAMLIYLDNAWNTEDSPNENFARELLELFTLGVNNYTQNDIVAAARAWTGYNVDDDDWSQYHYYDSRHDHGQKTFMGQTRAWTGPQIIDYVLSENATKKRIAAQFIATKLWKHFAYLSPEAELLDALTDSFYDSDLDITELLRTIFNRPEFRSNASRYGKVRSPVEWVVALHRALGGTATEWQPWYMDRMGQELFEPPNVAGWKHGDYWLSTTAMWARATYVQNSQWRINNMEPLPFSETFDMLPIDAVHHVLEQFEIDSPSEETVENLRLWLRKERDDNSAWDHWQVLNLVVLVALSPEFQMA
jgi:uncharacterized protein (DUF1800 family)